MRQTLVLYLLYGFVFAAPAAPPGSSRLSSIKVVGPNIVIRGSSLSKVEVWAVPTGTGITPDAYVLLGNATQTNSHNDEETWEFAIPSCETDTRLLATEVFAKGFDEKGKAVGKKSLPYVGVGALHDAICPQK